MEEDKDKNATSDMADLRTAEDVKDVDGCCNWGGKGKLGDSHNDSSKVKVGCKHRKLGRFWFRMNVEIMRFKVRMAVVGLREMEMIFSWTTGDFGLECWKFAATLEISLLNPILPLIFSEVLTFTGAGGKV